MEGFNPGYVQEPGGGSIYGDPTSSGATGYGHGYTIGADYDQSLLNDMSGGYHVQQQFVPNIEGHTQDQLYHDNTTVGDGTFNQHDNQHHALSHGNYSLPQQQAVQSHGYDQFSSPFATTQSMSSADYNPLNHHTMSQTQRTASPYQPQQSTGQVAQNTSQSHFAPQQYGAVSQSIANPQRAPVQQVSGGNSGIGYGHQGSGQNFSFVSQNAAQNQGNGSQQQAINGMPHVQQGRPATQPVIQNHLRQPVQQQQQQQQQPMYYNAQLSFAPHPTQQSVSPMPTTSQPSRPPVAATRPQVQPPRAVVRPQAPSSRISATPTTMAALRPTVSAGQGATPKLWGIPNLNTTTETLVRGGKKCGSINVILDPSRNLYKHMGRSAFMPAEDIHQVLQAIQPPCDDATRKKLVDNLVASLRRARKEIPRVYTAKLGLRDVADDTPKIRKSYRDYGDDGESPREEDVDDDSEEEDIRPSDPIGGAIWDAEQDLYLPGARNRFNAVAERVEKQLDKALEAANPNISTDEQILVGVLNTILENDRHLVAQMGIHQQILLRFFKLLDRWNKAGTLDGPLAIAALGWIAALTSINTKSFEVLKVPVRLNKYMKQAKSEEVKRLLREAQKVGMTVAPAAGQPPAGGQVVAPAPQPTTTQTQVASTTNNSSTTNTTQNITKPHRSSSKETTASLLSSPSKRPLESASEDRLSKKVALTPGSSLPKSLQSTKQSTQPSNSSASSASSSSAARPAPNSSGMLPGKARAAAKTPAKPEPTVAPNSSTMAPKASATKPTTKTVPKLPGSSKNELPKPAISKIKKTPVTKAAAPSGSSKLGALLEEISKPKEPVKPVATAKAATMLIETPEEKAKRLRKEARRHLSVRWKEGDELTQIKYIEGRNVEHTGVQDKTMRVEEGKALKEAMSKAKTTEQQEEDEDVVEKPWQTPVEINFASIAEATRARNFTSRGGLIAIDTPDQAAMKARENTVLMEIYTDPNDIPPTPKSPVVGAVDPVQNPRAEGSALPQDPRYAEIFQRWNESTQHGITWATQAALHRAHTKMAAAHSAAQAKASQPSPAPTYSGSASDEVLRLLQSDAVKNFKSDYDPAKPKTQRRYDYPDPHFQQIADNIENVVALLRNEPAIATQPPAWIKDPKRIEEWWKGYNRDQENKRKAAEKAQQEAAAAQAAAAQSQAATAATANPQDPSAAWNQYFAAHHAHNQGRDIPPEYQPAYQHWVMTQHQQALQQQPQPVQPQPADNGVQNLLAALSGTAQVGQAQPQQPGVQDLLAALAGNAQQSAPLPNPADPAALMQFISAQQAAGNQAQHGQGQQQGYGYDGSARGYGQDRDRERDYGRDQGNHQQHHGGRNKREGRENRGSRDSRDDSSVPNHLRGINRNLIGTKPCNFYLQGKCMKGDKCTFRHD